MKSEDKDRISVVVNATLERARVGCLRLSKAMEKARESMSAFVTAYGEIKYE